MLAASEVKPNGPSHIQTTASLPTLLLTEIDPLGSNEVNRLQERSCTPADTVQASAAAVVTLTSTVPTAP